MAQFDMDLYEPVDSRIKKFLKDHKDGRITTEIISDDENRTVFKAHIFVGEIEVATGHAKEIVGKGYVNQTSALENCETSAIGRGLANYGYSGDKRASREEMEKVERVSSYTKRDSSQPSYVSENLPTPKLVKCEHCGTLGKWHKKDCPNFVGVPGDKIGKPSNIQDELSQLNLGDTIGD